VAQQAFTVVVLAHITVAQLVTAAVQVGTTQRLPMATTVAGVIMPHVQFTIIMGLGIGVMVVIPDIHSLALAG
jgi:hypothetical protein